MRDSLRTRLSDESGLSKLEALGLFLFIVSLLSLFGPIREFAVNSIGIVFDQRDADTGELTDFSVAARGFGIVFGAIVVFVGFAWVVLWTDLGKRLSILVAGAGVFGWLVINGFLFVVYAPRGIRPENLEGLNAMEVRIPAIAMTAVAFILFLMFLTALSRYESDTE
ncbi:MAG: hypothetical protein E2O95_01280 [Acidobacteria bacterium]|nr:MAG: hypothetical protein E2O95_01280 [Acidobacteriota bacterium]